MLFRKIVNTVLSVLGVVITLTLPTGCDVMRIYDDLEECPKVLSVRLEYDYNVKYADAFSHEVKSVALWAFDETGSCVWSYTESGDKLAEPGYVVDTPLKEGRYDFVAWCGLEGNEGFDLATTTPSTKEELEVMLRTIEESGMHQSSNHLKGLYHGLLSGVEFRYEKNKPTLKTVTLPLVKDTKDIRVMLHHLDGTPIKEEDFKAEIRCADNHLGWNNEVMADSKMVKYQPWSVFYGAIIGEPEEMNVITGISSLMFELSTSRLMLENGAELIVTRTSDNHEIIHVPLLDYFIMVKGHYGEMTDQEYLDRQDDYSIFFILDENNNWYLSNGVVVNKWVVVPPQHPNM